MANFFDLKEDVTWSNQSSLWMRLAAPSTAGISATWTRELAWRITDQEGWYISESSVYRILKHNDLPPQVRVRRQHAVVAHAMLPGRAELFEQHESPRGDSRLRLQTRQVDASCQAGRVPVEAVPARVQGSGLE